MGRPFFGAPYVMLHSLSHMLINAISLECGYPASSIKERIYANPNEGYGILLYTAGADSYGTLGGLGRGAGNCPMELLLGFLRNPKYNLRPVLDCVQNHIEPMRAKLLWGYDLPYLLTGMLNQHPRTAIKFKEAELKGVKGDILDFYDHVTQ